MQIDNHKLVALGVIALILAVVGGVATVHPRSQAGMTGAAEAPQTPYGTVKSVSGDTIVISMQAPFQTQPLSYMLMLTASTTVVRHVNKSPAEFQKELNAFKAGEASTSPIGYSVAPATAADIAPGAIIEAPGATAQGSVWRADSIIIDATASSTLH